MVGAKKSKVNSNFLETDGGGTSEIFGTISDFGCCSFSGSVVESNSNFWDKTLPNSMKLRITSGMT